MTDATLQGPRIVIFGGSSGMGLATAKLAAQKGGEVTVVSRNPARLAKAAGQIDGAEIVSLDIRDAASVRLFFEEREPFDNVVVSAAELTAGPLRQRSLEEARAAMESKFWGAVHVAHAARISPGGTLTLVSGMLGSRPSGSATMLSAINAALDNFARALASEMAPVRVNCVSPGRIDTEWWDYLPADERAKLLQRTADALPVKRIGRPEDVAAQIVQMMENTFMTGSVVLVDGGGQVA